MGDASAMNESWLQRVGLAVDEALNVIVFNGRPDQTISLHAALEARRGRRWACVLCRVLSVVVERDHCAKQFTSDPTSVVAAIRAGIALAALAAPLVGIGYGVSWVLRLLF